MDNYIVTPQTEHTGLILTQGSYTIPKSRRYAPRSVLTDANLSISPGEHVGVVGPNGSGKSTLLKVLAGMLRLQEGELYNNGISANDIGRQFQRSVHLVAGAPLGFYPRLTGIENLRFFAGLWGTNLTDIDATQLLSRVGLDREAARAAYAKYSLGMRQRLHIAAALLDSGVSIWLLDEPTTGLDSEGVRMLGQLIGETQELSKVIVSHDEEFLKHVCHRVVRLVEGELLP